MKTEQLFTNVWTERMGLRDWDIRINLTAEHDPEYFATMDYRDVEKVAQINIDKACTTPGQREAAIMHELVHLVIKPYTQIALRLAANSTSPMREYVLGQLEDAEEQVVESLVRSFGYDRFEPSPELVDQWPTFAPKREEPGQSHEYCDHGENLTSYCNECEADHDDIPF